MERLFEGKVALVTSAASAIERAVAFSYAAKELSVISLETLVCQYGYYVTNLHDYYGGMVTHQQ
ncbi:MAG: hypothetical protein M3004_10060 [Bacteroidota bacterium]|nr:hypothetical protein [Bacteroidota bacterium]